MGRSEYVSGMGPAGRSTSLTGNRYQSYLYERSREQTFPGMSVGPGPHETMAMREKDKAGHDFEPGDHENTMRSAR